MNDPSNGVPPQLLRHIHLVCNHKYAVLSQPNLGTMVSYLMEAPKITRDIKTMTWMFLLEPPPDGFAMLVWQPSQMGAGFASDGYVWADPEQAFSEPRENYTVEMYVHNSGFRPGYETMSTHARRRYRLTPGRGATPNSASVDPSLWLVHYYRAEPTYQFAAQKIPLSEQVRQSLAERKSLQSHGQLVRKEFMLHDRDSWPTVTLPGNTTSTYPPQTMGYPNNVMAHMSRSQHPAYLQQPPQGVGPSPAKRPRHASSSHGHISATSIPIQMPAVPQENGYDEEEMASGADVMDILTPQDISRHRYVQHHQWLEEVLSSPYDTRQIIPSELGLGRKGELESLTRDFFEAPTSASPVRDLPQPLKVTEEIAKAGTPVVQDIPTPRVGRMEPGMAEDFTRRATERVAQINAEMEKLKRQHAKRVAKINNGRMWKEAEHILRTDTLELINGNATRVAAGHEEKVTKLSKDLEKKVGMSIKPIKDVECIEKGGLEENTQGSRDISKDFEMSDIVGDLSGSEPQLPQHSEPQESTPLNHITPDNNAASATNVQNHPQPAPTDASTGEGHTKPEIKDTGTEDWVMVDKESSATPQEQDQEQAGFDSFTNEVMQSDVDMTTGNDFPNPEDNTQNDTGLHFDDHDFGGGIDFGDLGSAGDALSGYAQEIENMGADEQEALDMNGDGFGTAFQSTEGPAEGGPSAS